MPSPGRNRKLSSLVGTVYTLRENVMHRNDQMGQSIEGLFGPLNRSVAIFLVSVAGLFSGNAAHPMDRNGSAHFCLSPEYGTGGLHFGIGNGVLYVPQADPITPLSIRTSCPGLTFGNSACSPDHFPN